MMLLRSALLLLLPVLASCTTSTVLLQPSEPKPNCTAHEGVALINRDGVRLSLGQRPSAGYGIDHRMTERDGMVSIHYRETRPAEGYLTAQVITTPCVYVALPANWQTARVVNKDSGQTWEFRSPPVYKTIPAQ
ncbi:protease complex subunit PrcB family protein [Bacterioplanoides sp.]|uniref:protease complex subunit PrcB family protein n=1 Tax=Bacterioplanoides sp. TaxID=2066072 RepID=UPI003B005E5F